MLALYLLAAHLVGDFVFQTRWQAERKLRDYEYRARHVLVYCVPFVPIAVVFSRDWRYAGGFMSWLLVLHFATDSHRFRSTLGDYISWQFQDPIPNPAAQIRPRVGGMWDQTDEELVVAMQRPIFLPLGPNPWSAAPIMIDQALHVCQLALLGGIFLS